LDRQYDHKLAYGSRSLKKGLPPIPWKWSQGLSTKDLLPVLSMELAYLRGNAGYEKDFSQLWTVGDWEGILSVLVDKSYDFYEVRKCLKEAGEKPVIPRREGAIFLSVQDKERYQTRQMLNASLEESRKTKGLL